jgi:hypothetical protein
MVADKENCAVRNIFLPPPQDFVSKILVTAARITNYRIKLFKEEHFLAKKISPDHVRSKVHQKLAGKKVTSKRIIKR